MVENNLEESIKPDKELVISDIETLKILADPLHLQILDLLCVPRTVKQIAAHTKVSTTKLYYHIKQLEESGLIQVVSTRVVSGIIEKQYQVKAQNIKIDHNLFNSSSVSNTEEEVDLISAHFKRIVADIAASRKAGLIDREQDEDEAHRLLLIRSISRLNPDQAKMFYARLKELVEEFAGNEDENSTNQSYSFIGVLFPTTNQADENTD